MLIMSMVMNKGCSNDMHLLYVMKIMSISSITTSHIGTIGTVLWIGSYSNPMTVYILTN